MHLSKAQKVKGCGSLGEKWVGGVWEAGKEGTGSGILNMGGSGRNRENYATVHNILQSKQCKEAGANRNRVGTGIRGYGKWEVKTPVFPPPPTPTTTKPLVKLKIRTTHS